MIDVNAVRAQFPSLHRPAADGRPPLFFDNPAGTQVPQRVIDAVSHYYLTMNANSGGAFATSLRSDAMSMDTRAIAADFLNARDVHEIVMGPNMTSINFQLSRALARTMKPGDEIILTRMDHDANVAPWLRIAEDHDLIVRWIDIREADCTLNLDTLEAALSDRTRIVASCHASNAVGTVNPVRQIADMAHAAGALYVVDAVQSAPHIPIDVQAIDCDFLLCSAYKFFGPHIGVMYGRRELLETLPVYKVRPAHDEAPWRWETGTPSYETIAGTGAALRYLEWLGQSFGAPYASQFPGFTGRRLALKTAMAAMSDYERTLAARLIEILQQVSGLKIAGITDPAHFTSRVPTVVFALEGLTPDQVAEALAAQHIYVWSGNYYAQEIMNRLGRGDAGMVRVGLAHYNTFEELDRFEGALKAIAAGRTAAV